MIYEIGTPDHYDEDCSGTDCTIWIDVPDGYTIKLTPDADSRIYITPVHAKYAQGDIVIRKEE
jgi:hypothetical protein